LGPAAGFIGPGLRAELPGLRLYWQTVDGRLRPTPRAVRQRLHQLADRQRGASVIALRTQPVPRAYRAFFRQTGLDPDTARIPSEQAAVDRLVYGGYQSRGLLADALLIALVETGVPVWALDARRVADGGLGIRATVAGDRLGQADDGPLLPSGRLVVADAACVHAPLFGEPALAHGVGPRTTRITLFAVGVAGVSAVHLEEALWTCAQTLGSAGPR
jgi:DNA/RNA-binding domain of Phe-tRNA-synthetase-like protein